MGVGDPDELDAGTGHAVADQKYARGSHCRTRAPGEPPQHREQDDPFEQRLVEL